MRKTTKNIIGQAARGVAVLLTMMLAFALIPVSAASAKQEAQLGEQQTASTVVEETPVVSETKPVNEASAPAATKPVDVPEIASPGTAASAASAAGAAGAASEANSNSSSAVLATGDTGTEKAPTNTEAMPGPGADGKPAREQGGSEEKSGKIKIVIKDAPGSFEHSVYGVFATKLQAEAALDADIDKRPEPLQKIKIKADNQGISEEQLEYARYYLRMLETAAGYQLDSQILEVTLGEPERTMDIDGKLFLAAQSQLPSELPSEAPENELELIAQPSLEDDTAQEDVSDFEEYNSQKYSDYLEEMAKLGLNGPAIKENPLTTEVRNYGIGTLAGRNHGDPYTNGDMVKYAKGSMGPGVPTQDIWLLNVGIITSSIEDLGSAPAPNFDVPSSVKSIDPVRITGWGLSDFRITFTISNPRGIIFSGIGNIAHCIMPSKASAINAVKHGNLVLDYMEKTTYGHKGYFFLWIEGAGGAADDQPVGGVLKVIAEWEEFGKIALEKRSSNPGMTNGNDCYNLDDRLYAVYKTRADAAAFRDPAGVIDAGRDGENVLAWNYSYGGTFDWDQGTYYVREATAPTGYALDPTIYTVVVSAGKTTWVNAENGGVVYDVPLGDPVNVRIQKVDSVSGEPFGADDPSGLTLAGGLFTWYYYDGYYDTPEQAAASGTPKRTWILATKANGAARLLDIDPDYNYLAPGSDPLYHNSNGIPQVPLGTVVIKETTPPIGYLLPSPNPVSVLKIESDGNSVKSSIKTDGVPVDLISTGNTLIVPEKPHMVIVKKLDALTFDPIIFTEFTLYKESFLGSGIWDKIAAHTTDVTGICQFSPVAIGSYKIAETATNSQYHSPDQEGKSGYQLFQVTDATDNSELVFEFKDYHKEEQEVQKRDAEDDSPIADTQFTLYKYPVVIDDGLVLTDVSSIAEDDPAWEEVSRLTTDSSGQVQFDSLLFGYYKAVETISNPNYQNPEQEGLPGFVCFKVERGNNQAIVFNDYLKRQVEVEKRDLDNSKPIADTEFTISSYPSSIKDGLVDTDVSQVLANDPAWKLIGTKTTDDNGKLVFADLPFGYYKIEESCPNPLYASQEERGNQPHLFKLEAYQTAEVQVFEDDLIQISCEVYKQTIALTSSAFDGTNVGLSNNVGHEEYLYHFGGRSTANVRADEFVITDDMSFVNSLGYRMTTLWTGTSPVGLDHDNKMAILYQTNYTSVEDFPSFAYHPLSGNPYNANNKDLTMVYSDNPGWRIWAEELPTTTASRLDVSSLGLAKGEYITGLKVVYGGVEKGFYAGQGWESEGDPHTVKVRTQSSAGGDLELLAEDAIASEDFYYSVKATKDLAPIDKAGNETVMRGSIRADIARNAGVLTDFDADSVQTRVISSFTLEDSFQNKFYSPRIGFPRTGDNSQLWLVLLSLSVIGTIAFGIRYFVRRRKSDLDWQ